MPRTKDTKVQRFLQAGASLPWRAVALAKVARRPGFSSVGEGAAFPWEAGPALRGCPLANSFPYRRNSKDAPRHGGLTAVHPYLGLREGSRTGWVPSRGLKQAKKVLALEALFIVIIRTSGGKDPSPFHPNRIMKIEIATCLLSVALLSACSSTSQTTADHQTLEQRLMAKYANTDTATSEPAPPAAGPEDVPADAPTAAERNPALVPTPLLRYWASSRTP